MAYFGSGITFEEQINNQGTAPNANFQALLFGRRTTGGSLIQPPVGSSYSQPNLFIPIPLPYFNDGVSAVNYLVNNYGFIVSWGKQYNPLSFPAPSIITNLANSQVILTWTSLPVGFSNLVGTIGGITQGSATGTILQNSVKIINNVGYMTITVTSGTFTTSGTVVITATNPNIQEPNPSLSDEIVVGVFKFYQQNTVLPANNQPTCWISVLNDNCTTICPDNVAISLVAPTTVTVEPDNSVTLTYSSSADGLGYLTTTYFNNSTVSQETSNASGTYNGYTVDALGNVDINVTNVTGTFVTTSGELVNITLDPTNNAFNYLSKHPINKFCLPFKADTLTALTTTQSAFYNGIMNLNNGSNFNQGQFFAQGYYATQVAVGQLNGVSCPNSQYFKHIWKGDQPTVFDPVEIPLGIASANAYCDLNVPVPYYGQTNVTLALNASSNQATYPSTSIGGACDIAVNLGLTPLYVDSTGQVKIYRNVNTLQTINGSVDVEFRYESVTSKQAWLQLAVYNNWNNVLQSPQVNGGMVLNSAQVRNDFNNANIQSLLLGQKYGMFQNVEAYQKLCSVTINPTDPTGVIVVVPNQCVPELSNAKTTVQMYTIYYNFSNTSTQG